MSPATDVTVLRRIESSARAVRLLTAQHSVSTPRQSSIVQHTLRGAFLAPQPISQLLISLGLSPAVAEKISAAYCRTAMQLKIHAERQHNCGLLAYSQPDPTGRLNSEKLAAMFSSVLNTRYMKVLRGWQDEIVDMVSARIGQFGLTARDTPLTEKPAKRPFNQAAVPVLERFFDHNQRPTRAEKERLATQTDMKYKQVSIWFQNRRNRSKKALRVDSTHQTGRLPPDLAASLVRILGQYVASAQTGMGLDTESDTPANYAQSFAPFGSERPRHAFPVCYPPLCSYDPFPVAAEVRKLSTPWYRSASAPRQPFSTPDVSELLTILERFHLEDEETGPKPHRPTKPPHIGHSGVPSFTTIPPPAPLPALIRSPACLDCGSSRSSFCDRQRSPRLARQQSATRVPGALLTESAGHSQTPLKGRRLSGAVRDVIPKSKRSETAGFMALSCSSSTAVPSTTRCISSDASSSSFSLPAIDNYVSSVPLNLEDTLGHSAQGKRLRRKALAPSRRVRKASHVSSSSCFPPSTFPPESPLEPSTLTSSIRSVSSASSTSSESDTLLTPPLPPRSLSDFSVLGDVSTFGLCSDIGDVLDENISMTELPSGGYVGYSLGLTGVPGSMMDLSIGAEHFALRNSHLVSDAFTPFIRSPLMYY